MKSNHNVAKRILLMIATPLIGFIVGWMTCSPEADAPLPAFHGFLGAFIAVILIWPAVLIRLMMAMHRNRRDSNKPQEDTSL